MPPRIRGHLLFDYGIKAAFYFSAGGDFGRPFKDLNQSTVAEAAEKNESDYDDEPRIFIVECIGKATAHK